MYRIEFTVLLMLTLLVMLPLLGCAATPHIVPSRAACSSLLPDSWKAPVPGAMLPEEGSTDLDRLKAWMSFGVEQTGQLDKANERTPVAIGIIERCEARDRAAVETVRRAWWQVWK